MSVGLSDGRWLLPLRLALVSMLVTVALIAGAGVVWLGLPLGAAILLGGILAPTDPVLASDVQVAEPNDRDRLRFALTGEAGLNDGTAFPFVLLGLGLLGLHHLGHSLWRWLAVDVLWGVGIGIGIGALLGSCGRQASSLYLRRTHKEAVGLDNFLALGLIGVCLRRWRCIAARRRLPRGGRGRRRAAARRAPGDRRRGPAPGARRPRVDTRAQPAMRQGEARAAAEPLGRARRRKGRSPTPTPPLADQAATDLEARAGLHGARDAELQRSSSSASAKSRR